MEIKELWKFPVPSTYIAEGGVRLIFPGGPAILLFDYYDEDESGATYNLGIIFQSAQSHRHSSEKFIKFIPGAYDTLVEIVDSDWVMELREINKEIADYWDIRHYAIILDSNGIYEFIARDYDILDTKEGRLSKVMNFELEMTYDKEKGRRKWIMKN